MSSQNAANLVTLVVGGAEFGGWKSARIEAGIERQARSFDLEVTDRWPGQTNIPRRIQPGDACQVYIGQDLVVTGYVDATPIKYDGRSLGVGVKGRSKTADLVDCCPIGSDQNLSAVVGLWRDVVGADGTRPNVIAPPAKSALQWRGQKMEVIAAALAAPYGVRVIAEVDTGAPIPEHQVQVGEKVFESIDRMMRLRHVLSTDNAAGDLVFIDVGSAGRATTAIETGVNVLSATTDLDYKEVYSDYVVKGQRAGSDDDFGDGVSEEEGQSEDDSSETATGDTASTSDARAKRHRLLVLKQVGQASDGTCQDRADYERAHRAAKALQTIYTVPGWRQQDGGLWLPNLLVPVRDPVIGFNTEMVIALVAYVLDHEGQRAELTVGPKDGYRTKAAKAQKQKGRSGASWSDVK